MPLPVLHLLDHIIPPLTELPLLLHRPLLHLAHLHPLDHLLKDRISLHQLVPPMTLRDDMSSRLRSPARPAAAQLTLVDWQLLPRLPLNQVLQPDHSPFLLLQELLEGWRGERHGGQRGVAPARPSISDPAQVLLGLAVHPHHPLLPQAHPAHQAGEQPALVEESGGKGSLVLLEVHQVDDVLPKGYGGDPPLFHQPQAIHPLMLWQRLL